MSFSPSLQPVKPHIPTLTSKCVVNVDLDEPLGCSDFPWELQWSLASPGRRRQHLSHPLGQRVTGHEGTVCSVGGSSQVAHPGMEISQGKGHMRLDNDIWGPKGMKPPCRFTAPVAGHVHVASSAILERHYFLPLLEPQGDQLRVSKGKMRRKKNLSCSPAAREHGNSCERV